LRRLIHIVCAGDFVAVSKLIYKIGAELKQGPEAAADYQLLSIELEALDRTMKSLEHIQVAQHGQKRLDAIRALALACQLPLQEFLEKIEKFDESLGPWNTKNRSFSAITQRLRWSAKYKDEARYLRARLAPNVATITVLLMTQTVDIMSNAKSERIIMVRKMKDSLTSQSHILAALQATSCRIADAQETLATRQTRLIAAALRQDRDLRTLQTKAEELLQSNDAHGQHLHRQTEILEDVYDNTVFMRARAHENHVLVTSIHQDVADVKASCSSILGRALDLLDTVLKGVSRMQDITRLMNQMVCLTARFTTEMKETMGKLLQAFGTLQRQLSQLESLTHRRICPPIVVFRDAFNIMRSFPYDLSRDWQTFQGLVAVAFHGRQGLHRVNMGQYFITSSRIGRRLNPTFWSNAIEPGDELSMTMMLNDVETEEDTCPYLSCGASTADIASCGGGKICPNCFRFAIISQRNESSPQSAGVYETPESVPERVLESKDMIGLPRPLSPLPRLLEEEDIELYYSIQVSRAPTLDESSTALVQSTTPNLSAIHIHIFIKHSLGEDLALPVSPFDLVNTVKDKIQEREGIPQRLQRLIFAGKQLQDGVTLAEYNVQRDNTLYLVWNLPRKYAHSRKKCAYVFQCVSPPLEAQ